MRPPMLVLAVLRSPADKRAPRKKAARRVRKLRRYRIGWRRSKMKDDAVNGPRDREWDESRPREQILFYPAKGPRRRAAPGTICFAITSVIKAAAFLRAN